MSETPSYGDYACADCGGQFVRGRPDEDAHQEAIEKWGVDGHASGMAEVCEECYRAIMDALGRHP